jgi:hypothetical protein
MRGSRSPASSKPSARCVGASARTELERRNSTSARGRPRASARCTRICCCVASAESFASSTRARYDGPQPGVPDPSQSSNPEITFTEKTFRDAEGLHYERYIYAPENIENYVLCKLDPRYEAYFMAIAQRAGRSLRAIGGGMYKRPAHEDGP